MAVAAIPFAVGRLPTTTQPPGSTVSAVVRPIPPGHGPGRWLGRILANTLSLPPGVIWTMVRPVPCRFFLLLKLLMSTLPRCRSPWVCWMTTVPYGLTSPLPGTVEAIVLRWWKWPINEDPLDRACAPAAGARTKAAVAAAATPAAEAKTAR